LERGGLAVVGSRKPDPESEDYAKHVGRWAASADVQIVSGAARGVDATAMLACVDAGGTALGIVAEPLLRLSTRTEFRDAILQKRLCLISSFDPEAAFTVGNAMGRNRWIYALADRGLVVACSEDRGGTWAGAIEAIERGVDVYVKTGNAARPGNEALVRRGAHPAPEDLADILHGQPSTRADAQPQAPFSAMTPSGDLFATAAAPAILALLDRPRSAAEIAEALGVVKKQADMWLGRLVADQRVVKQRAKFRRASAADPMQSSLFTDEQP
jgi:predicted Rossmann fold nucleotide-binding protein DprA/Smf involved in DNA uptake